MEGSLSCCFDDVGAGVIDEPFPCSKASKASATPGKSRKGSATAANKTCLRSEYVARPGVLPD